MDLNVHPGAPIDAGPRETPINRSLVDNERVFNIVAGKGHDRHDGILTCWQLVKVQHLNSLRLDQWTLRIHHLQLQGVKPASGIQTPHHCTHSVARFTQWLPSALRMSLFFSYFAYLDAPLIQISRATHHAKISSVSTVSNYAFTTNFCGSVCAFYKAILVVVIAFL